MHLGSATPTSACRRPLAIAPSRCLLCTPGIPAVLEPHTSSLSRPRRRRTVTESIAGTRQKCKTRGFLGGLNGFWELLGPPRAMVTALEILSPCLLGAAPLLARFSCRGAISEVSRTAAACASQDGVSYLCEISIMTKLYVGNLPFTATEESVRNLFAPHGTVEKISLINDRDTGQPRAFGFVEMSSADASRAMQALNGADFGGRPLKINEAQDKARSGGGGGGGGGRPRY